MTRFTRRSAMGLLASIGSASTSRSASSQTASIFGFENVRSLAAALAADPHVLPPLDLPQSLADLSYDQYRDIRFRPSHTIPVGRSSFHVQPFHPGFLFRRSITLNIVTPWGVTPIQYDPEMFDFGGNSVEKTSSDIGFAGFKIVYPLNEPNKLDEVISFLGSSYFRFLGRGQRYGISARGLSIGSGDAAQAEEFPFFREFWIEQPSENSATLRLFALLDSESVTGAFQFMITPEEHTRIDVRSALFPRVELFRTEIAPLTSMFFHGRADRGNFDDFRPNVHDSDILAIRSGERWFVSPLENPSRPVRTTLNQNTVEGFGLLQRERRFDLYQDLEAEYDLRPGYWVERLSEWGPGTVVLVELPTRTETEDNVVAFWSPAIPLAAGVGAEFRYRLTALGADTDLHALGRVVSTRYTVGGSKSGKASRRVIVDFAGGDLEYFALDVASVNLVVSATGGAVTSSRLRRHPLKQGFRASLDIECERDVETRVTAFLGRGTRVLTETWVYRVVPDQT